MNAAVPDDADGAPDDDEEVQAQDMADDREIPLQLKDLPGEQTFFNEGLGANNTMLFTG